MDDSATHESVTVPVDGDRKIRTVLWTHQSTGFVTVPSEKRKCTLCEVRSNFFEPWRGEEKYEQWATFPSLLDDKPSNKGFIISLLFSVFSVLILVCELNLTALSMHRIDCITYTRKTKTTRTNPLKCSFCSFLPKSSLLLKVKFEKRKINQSLYPSVWPICCYVVFALL